MASNATKKIVPTGTCSENVDYVASSEVQQETLSFLWSVKGISALQKDEFIRSPPFQGGPKNNYDWMAVAGKKTTTDPAHPADAAANASQTCLSINLQFTSRSKKTPPSTAGLKPTVKACFQICLLDTDDKSVWKSALPEPPVFTEFEEGVVRGFGRFVLSMDRLNDPSKRVLVDDTLRIYCRIWTRCELQHDLVVSPKRRKMDRPTLVVSEDLFNRTNELKRDFKSGLDNSELADVSLVTPTKTLKAHKFVLSARSPVFQAMFRSPMVESTQNVVHISDFSAEVVEGMLEYMYTGECSNMTQNTGRLLRIADKYQLMGLKADCEELIKCHLTCENAAKILSLAHQVNSTELKLHVLQYINKNKESVLKTTGFMELIQTNAELLMELLSRQ